MVSPLPREVDVVVVGAGAAGSLYAARLATAGWRVLVLERGPAWRLDDLVSSQIWARRLKWGGATVHHADGPPRFTEGHGTGHGLGGAALHHYGTWLRLRPSDFRLKSQFGVGTDWPLDYADLRPFYDSIQTEMGLAGDSRHEVGRPSARAYPMPPHPLFRQARALEKGFKASGLTPSALPLAINSREYKGRPACQYDGWCDAGCPTGALANPLVTHLAQARAAGARIEAACTVTRVLCNARGRARGVEVLHQGERQEVAAPWVVLAASVVQNPRLLLGSVSNAHPRGLGNSNGLIGTGLMVDVVAPVHGLLREPTDPHMGVNAGQLLFRREHAERPLRRPAGAYQWQIAPSHKPNDLLGMASTRAELHGQALHAFLQDAAQHLASAYGFAAALPQLSNRITVDIDPGGDGLPRARVHYQHSEATLKLREHLLAEGARALQAAGARSVWTGPLAGGHLAGGTPMGRDASDSVCDSYGRLHDSPNVVLAGSGTFPGGSGTSPTFTVYALAERSVRQLINLVTP